MNRFSVAVALFMFGLGTIVGQSMISPAATPAAAKDQTISVFDLQRNAPALLPVQHYDAV